MKVKELHERQAWSLYKKIDHSLGVIDQFLNRVDGRAVVSFSGGKDSTVLLHLCEILKPDIKAMFINTGNEFPDIVYFVRAMRKTHNIDIIRPKMTPREIWSKYGFPLVSKETADKIEKVRRNPNCKTSRNFLGLGEKTKFIIPNRYRYLIDTPYCVSNKCCNVMKKATSHRYCKEHNVFPIIGTMACESKMRETAYVHRGGCNAFEGKIESNPLSIWVEDDIWAYIKDRNLKIADIYHKGARRTGCVGCGFGAQFSNDHRFEVLYNLYPKFYEMIMNYENNGVKYRDALREMLAKVGKTLPDEGFKELTIFDFIDS